MDETTAATTDPTPDAADPAADQVPGVADLSALPGCTCSALRKAARRVSMIYDQCLEPYELTITQYGLLVQLRRLGPLGVGALAQRLIMDPTTLTRNLRPLERRGFVTSEEDPQDRRARRLGLTEAGRAALRRARPGWQRAQQQVEQSLGTDETLRLHRSLAVALEQLTP